MKHLFYGILLALFPTLPCLAQEEEPLEKPLPKIILQTGIGLQWFGDGYKHFILSAERPTSQYWLLGLQATTYFERQEQFTFTYSELLSGLEIGGTAKYFLHGRLSGRKSGLYIGPELRYGQRKFRYPTDNVFPPPPVPTYKYFQENIYKVMFRWGLQYRFGHAILELSAPFGIEFLKSNQFVNQDGLDQSFVLLPMLQFGFAF